MNSNFNNQGGIYQLAGINYFEDINSLYKNSQAIQGGAIYSQGTSIILTNCTFINSFAIYGGVFYLANTAYLNMTNVSIMNSIAY